MFKVSARARIRRGRRLAFLLATLLSAVGMLAGTWLAATAAATGPSCTINWVGPATAGSTQDWGTDTNWADTSTAAHRLPGASDYACIEKSGFTVALTSGSDVSIAGLDSQASITLNVQSLSLTDKNQASELHAKLDFAGGTLVVTSPTAVDGALKLDPGTLNGPGTLTINGGASWTGGYMYGTGSTSVASGATLKVAPGGVQYTVLTDRRLNNAGTIDYTPAGGSSAYDAWYVGGYACAQPAALDTTGTFNYAGPDTGDPGIVNQCGGTTITNTGTFQKTGSGNSDIQPNFTNKGRLVASAGTLTVDTLTNYAPANGTTPGTLTGGRYDVYGTLAIPGASIVDNAAEVWMWGSGAKITDGNGNDALANFTTNLPAGKFELHNGANFTSANPFEDQGYVFVDRPSAFKAPHGGGDFNQDGGSLRVRGWLQTTLGVHLKGAILYGTGTCPTSGGSVTGPCIGPTLSSPTLELTSSGLVIGEYNSGPAGIGTLSVFGTFRENDSNSTIYADIGTSTADHFVITAGAGSSGLSGTPAIGQIAGRLDLTTVQPPTAGQTNTLVSCTDTADSRKGCSGTFSSVTGTSTPFGTYHLSYHYLPQVSGWPKMWDTASVTFTASANNGQAQDISHDTTPSSCQGAHATQVEPATFAHGSTIVSAFQSGRFNDGGACNLGFATFTNSGQTWSTGLLPGTTKFASPAGTYDRVDDASVAYDAKLNTWLIAGTYQEDPVTTNGGLSCGNTAGTSQPPCGRQVMVSRLTSGASTWSSPVAVTPRNATADYDKNWIACDNSPTSRYPGRCYSMWMDLATTPRRILGAYSDNGGATWTAIATPPAPPSGSYVIANGPIAIVFDGTVVVPYRLSGTIAAATSSDGGQTWTMKVISSLTFASSGGVVRNIPMPTAAVDNSGRVYVVWPGCLPGTTCKANGLLMSLGSESPSSHIVSFTSPTSVISQNGSQTDLIPGLGVDSSTGGSGAHVAITYYHYPSTCSAPCTQVNAGLITSDDGGSTWNASKQLNATAMTSTWLAPNVSGPMLADYIQTVFSSGHVVSVLPLATAPASTAALHEDMYAASN